MKYTNFNSGDKTPYKVHTIVDDKKRPLSYFFHDNNKIKFEYNSRTKAYNTAKLFKSVNVMVQKWLKNELWNKNSNSWHYIVCNVT